MKDIKLCTNDMNVLANDNELLKYIEIWNEIELLFNKKFNKPTYNTYNNKYIKTNINSYNENFHDFEIKKINKRLILWHGKKEVLSSNIFR